MRQAKVAPLLALTIAVAMGPLVWSAQRLAGWGATTSLAVATVLEAVLVGWLGRARTSPDEARRLRGIVDSAMDAIVTVDEEQRITQFNPAAERVFGYGARDVLGKSLDVLIPAAFRDVHAAHVRAFGVSGVTRRAMGALTPVRGLRADGGDFPIEASISQVTVGGRRFFTAILRDITERQRAEEALRRSQDQLRLLIEQAPVALAMFDREMRYLAVSNLWRDLYSRGEQLVGRSHYEANPDLPEDWRDFHDRALAGEVMGQQENLWVQADGSARWLRRSAHPWRDVDGAIGGIIVSREDITERKRVEERSLRAQKLEALGTLAGGIAHDFNNILVAIAGNAKLSRMELPEDHPAQVGLVEIAKASARASDLVRRIVAFARPSEAREEVVEPGPIVAEVLGLLARTVPATIALEADVADDAPPIRIDSSQLHEILVNMVNNSVHAIGSRAGRVQVRVAGLQVEEPSTLAPRELAPGRYCRISLVDDGCGMDDATRARVFDPFFTTKGLEGTGLGLSMVHGVLRAHGGAVSVYSEKGRGTTFHLYFPAAGGAAPAGAAPAVRSAVAGADRRVLYVDDDEALLFLAERMLGGLGFRVTSFSSPVRALEAFRERPHDFDVVVTDLAMPHLSGSDLSRELLRIRPTVPILMTSGYVRLEDAEAARALGIRELVEKPDSVEELDAAIARALAAEEPG